MNVRQQLYKKYRLEGMSKYASARKAGYSHNTATQAKRIEKYINMAEWLEICGLTDKALAKHAQEGLNATKIIGYIQNYKQSEKGLEKIKPEETISNEFLEAPDWSARHKYYDTILKIKGQLKDATLIDQSQHLHNTVIWEVNGNKVQAPRKPRPSVGRPEPVSRISSR